MGRKPAPRKKSLNPKAMKKTRGGSGLPASGPAGTSMPDGVSSAPGALTAGPMDISTGQSSGKRSFGALDLSPRGTESDPPTGSI